MVKVELMLEGLGCASCAAKMETQIKKLSAVNNASVDFISKKLTIEAEDAQEYDRLISDASNIIKKIEPDVMIINLRDSSDKKENRDEENSNKGKIIRIIVSGILFVAALILSLPKYVEISLFLLSYIIVGGEILLRSFKNIRGGHIFDENFLMSIATIGAFIIKEFPEGVAVMLFYQIGELFQDIAVERSRKSISELMDIRPDYANLKIGGDLKRVSPDVVKIGDIIVVKPGERIPLDGRVIDGVSMVDTSSLTGESVPREVKAGNDVLSGFINNNGALTIEVTKGFEDSTVSKILDLVQNAGSKKAPTENFITKFARYYTPIVVITAVFIAIIPPVFIKGAVFSDWVYRALIFLVISCPCALVISIPLGFFGGIGAASRRGILVKGSNYLESLNNIETIVFDKTGTLTKGVFNVTDIKPQSEYAEGSLLEYAAYAESFSNHPIATSIIRAYEEDIDNSIIEEYEEILGLGVRIRIRGEEVLAGNSKLMDNENIEYNKAEAAGTVVYIAVNKLFAGYIVISDEIRDDSVYAINALKKLGVKNIFMLTGDLKSVGESVGRELGIEHVFSELLPNEKVDKLEQISNNSANGGRVVFVGDGINDAPVLARADIGIAMGGLGSDAAIEAADIVIMTDEPSKIETAIRVAKRTNQIVWQNIIFALGIKAIILLLGAAGFANMWEAVFADVGVTVIAVLNSMRVMKFSNL